MRQVQAVAVAEQAQQRRGLTRQVRERALPAALEILRRHLGSVVLVAGHNVVNRVLLATWMHVPLAKARGIEQDNCGVNVIRFRRDSAHVLTLNAAFHLR